MAKNAASKTRDLPITEITLRKYERPEDLTRREIVKRFCLSIGVLQPGDSRDVIVDIMQVMLDSAKKKEMLLCTDIEKLVVKKEKRKKSEQMGLHHQISEGS
jgi:hypothetical protein